MLIGTVDPVGGIDGCLAMTTKKANRPKCSAKAAQKRGLRSPPPPIIDGGHGAPGAAPASFSEALAAARRMARRCR